LADRKQLAIVLVPSQYIRHHHLKCTSSRVCLTVVCTLHNTHTLVSMVSDTPSHCGKKQNAHVGEVQGDEDRSNTITLERPGPEQLIHNEHETKVSRTMNGQTMRSQMVVAARARCQLREPTAAVSLPNRTKSSAPHLPGNTIGAEPDPTLSHSSLSLFVCTCLYMCVCVLWQL
jgi:hypothetical protein